MESFVQFSPSILSADFSKLGEEIALAERAGADFLHFDVMDGHFVPNISFGAPVMKCLVGKTKLPFDVHLMIENPDKYIEDFISPQTEYIVVHAEACVHLNRTIAHIRSLGIKPGVALNPATSLSVLDYALADVDLVLLMSVNPGFGGQSFIPSALKKAEALAKLRRGQGLNFKIEIDGGVSQKNVKAVVESGVDIVVAGSAFFGSEMPEEWWRGCLGNVGNVVIGV